MPSEMPTSSAQRKSQRVLACVLCQQRKVKCDRKFPCANCVKSQAQCVPGTLAPRQRRRRFPERALLERLRKYEDLLRQNKVPFEPLHHDPPNEKDPSVVEGDSDSEAEHPGSVITDVPTVATAVGSDRSHEVKNVWHAMNKGFRDPDDDSDSSHDDLRENAVKKAWRFVGKDDQLLFGSRTIPTNLTTSHPDPVQIFRLWQIYLDNVHPLLKVTHTPTLQGRIIEAVGNLSNLEPNLEALMFSIYCMAIMSLDDNECQAIFVSSKQDLLVRYQLPCQQALLNCSFLRSDERDCLTALFLYLISVRPSTVPQSLSAMLGIAIRLAQRMGIDDEGALSKCTILEAELRRRLWWSLMFFDSRMGEMTKSSTATLNPIWNCNIPLNVNDSDLRPEMKEPPTVHVKCTDALFPVVRAKIGDFIRHSGFHTDFINPALKPLAKQYKNGTAQENAELLKLQEAIEEHFLRFCDENTPIHFMTIWTARLYIAKYRLIEHLYSSFNTTGRSSDAQQDVANSHALRMLQCDAKIVTSPLTKRFLWLHSLQFPFPAYFQILQILKRRPLWDQAQYAWQVMSDSYEGWIGYQFNDDGPHFQIFARMVLLAWEACEAATETPSEDLMPPRIVSLTKDKIARLSQQAQESNLADPSMVMDPNLDESLMSMPVDFMNQTTPYSMDMNMQDSYPMAAAHMHPNFPAQAMLDTRINRLNWTAFPGGRPPWAWPWG